MQPAHDEFTIQSQLGLYLLTGFSDSLSKFGKRSLRGFSVEQPLIPMGLASESEPARPDTRSRQHWITELWTPGRWTTGRWTTARRWQLLLVAGWLVQAGLRAWLSRAQSVPMANPDETAYLVSARLLAGGPIANLQYSTLYPGGYPLLIAPVFWFTHDPVTGYHAVLIINALISALIMPLAFVACRRLGLDRWPAYAVAFVTALLPAALFYSAYALTDAIYPVIVLAWLLATHSWLTAKTTRGSFTAAVGSALLAGYADMVHSRGLVIIACYAVVGIFVFVRRLVPRKTVAAAALVLLFLAAIGWELNVHLGKVLYSASARSLSGTASSRLHNIHGVILVVEMAFGQMWQFTLDTWGVAAIGLVVAVAVLAKRSVPVELRLIAGLAVAVTLITAISVPAALPSNQGQIWASGRYLDGMSTAFFIPGAIVLLRATRVQILACLGVILPAAAITGLVVAHYAGLSVPTAPFGPAFNFATPAVLTQDWTQANVILATGVAIALLAVCVAIVTLLPRQRAIVLAGLAAVSLVAVTQMSSHVSQAYTPAQKAATIGLVSGAGLGFGDQVAVSSSLIWEDWIPQAYVVGWAPLEFFSQTAPPPANADIVEVPWPAGAGARDSWPTAPAGWHVVATDSAAGWVAWREP